MAQGMLGNVKTMKAKMARAVTSIHMHETGGLEEVLCLLTIIFALTRI